MKKSLFLLFSIYFFSLTAQTSYTINVGGASNTFVPAILTINVGDTVIWNNTGGLHNVNATLATYPNNPEGFGNGVASAPWSFQWVFTMQGTYDYQCDPHIPLMVGVVIANAIQIPGCTDSTACNYDPTATIDDGSCTYLSATINLTDTIMCSGNYTTIQVITLGGAFLNTQFLYLLEYYIFGNWYQLSTQTTYDTATFTLLPANNYRVTVTDPSGIYTAQAFINITQPPNIMATFSITNPSLCFGDSVADLHLNVFGGTPPYTVTLNGGPSMPITANNIDFLNVPAGSYQVIITDANGCTKIRNQTITPGNGVCGCTDSLALNFNATATVDDSTCYYCSITTNVTQWLPTTVSACDGFINVTTSGTAPYAYSWNNGNTTALNLNLCDGAYTYTVIDSNGCGFTETIILTAHLGCTDSTAMNYNPTAIVDDGSCIAFVYGCTR